VKNLGDGWGFSRFTNSFSFEIIFLALKINGTKVKNLFFVGRKYKFRLVT
jgi:hypothetical protein